MQGRRRPDGVKVLDMAPGDYGKPAIEGGGWWAVLPNGERANLRGHTVTEHEDGTISVSPSILTYGVYRWHGFLERGVWREV